MALSAAHEIRDDARRVSFFREAKRVLRPGGRVVVIEQLRDLPNFLCFGAAAFHFLSRNTWLRSFRDSGLILEREFSITPFMRAFVLN
jgi:ubiquinone/menaquinone biosynthesis C-methylase UbiE